jgi:hypothetical protein
LHFALALRSTLLLQPPIQDGPRANRPYSRGYTADSADERQIGSQAGWYGYQNTHAYYAPYFAFVLFG